MAASALTRAASTPLNIRLLRALRAFAGESVALERLGPDPARVSADLDALASFGFAIERHPDQSASYAGPTGRLCPEQIEDELGTRRIGRRIAVWGRVTSTSDVAAAAAGSISNDGLVVLAEEQTAGRGRLGRIWTAPPRSSILMSVLLFPQAGLLFPAGNPSPADPRGPDELAWLTALGAVASAEVVAAWTGCAASIKWPNDVRVGGRKVSGILVERPVSRNGARGAAVIGIGLNVDLAPSDLPADIRDRVTSIRAEAPGTVIDRSEIARDLIGRLDHWYDTVLVHGPSALSAAWRDRNELVDRPARISTFKGVQCGTLVDLDLSHGLTLIPNTARSTSNQTGPCSIRIPLAEIVAVEPVAP